MGKPDLTVHVRGRVVARKAPDERQLAEGLIWVEAYLPFDVAAFAAFEALARKKGKGGAPDYDAAAAADPELAKKALEPIDSHGEAMLQEDVIALAHAFLVQSRKMDVAHDQAARPTLELVESFVNGPEIASPHFAPGAWVVVFKVAAGSAEWEAVQKGELNAVSFQAVVSKVPITVILKEAA